MAVSFGDRREAAQSLQELAAELKVGCEARQVRLSPHVVIHSQSSSTSDFDLFQAYLLPDWPEVREIFQRNRM